MSESEQPQRGPADRPSRPLVVVSNREPYLHSLAEDGTVTWEPTAGGVAVALDALMRERGGVWLPMAPEAPTDGWSVTTTACWSPPARRATPCVGSG